MKRRTLVSLTLTLTAFAAAGDLLLLTARGARAPVWAHWWCSASGLHPASRHGGQAHSLVATLLGYLGAVLPHWPHILPLVVAVTTLVYLWRANARYHAHDDKASKPPAMLDRLAIRSVPPAGIRAEVATFL